jgi:hypothetical protein
MVNLNYLLILLICKYLIADWPGEESETEKPHADVFHGFTQPAQLDNLLLSTQGSILSLEQCLDLDHVIAVKEWCSVHIIF